MSDSTQVGSIIWTDLTVPDAENVREFYSQVVGWKSSPVDMGGYSDFNMQSPDSDQAATGICHKRGANSDIPSQWMIYIMVADLDESIQRCTELGGEVISGPTSFGSKSRYCIIRDPAGATSALCETKE